MQNREQRDRERDGYYSDRNELMRERERERGYMSDHNSRYVICSSVIYARLHCLIICFIIMFKSIAFQHRVVHRALANRLEPNGSGIRMAGVQAAQHLARALAKA